MTFCNFPRLHKCTMYFPIHSQKHDVLFHAFISVWRINSICDNINGDTMCVESMMLCFHHILSNFHFYMYVKLFSTYLLMFPCFYRYIYNVLSILANIWCRLIYLWKHEVLFQPFFCFFVIMYYCTWLIYLRCTFPRICEDRK